MAIGILALQGAFAEHETMLDRLGAAWFEIRQKRDLEKPLDGLILPGGESTVMGKLLRDLDLFETLQEKIRAGLPVYGTCAGLILLADQVEGGIPCFATMDLTAKRNAYGRQLGSFHTVAQMEGVGEIPMTFIRAPYIAAVGPRPRCWQKWTATSSPPARAASWSRPSTRSWMRTHPSTSISWT